MKKNLMLLIAITNIVIISNAQTPWYLTGNSISSTDFIGSTNAQPLVFKVNNARSGLIQYDGNAANTGFGYETLLSNTGVGNTATGYQALNANTSGNYNSAFGTHALIVNTTGGANSAFGCFALRFNTTGAQNVGLGFGALFSNTTGNYNVSAGYRTLTTNTTGSNNTAFGHETLLANTTGQDNLGIGFRSLRYNTTGFNNIAIGLYSLYSNTTAGNSIAIGTNALYSNTTVGSNIAIGNDALYSNQTSYANTAVGRRTLYYHIYGAENTALGEETLENNLYGLGCTAVGYFALNGNNGSYNTALGYQADVNSTHGNSTAIGNSAVANAANKIRLGDVNVTVIEGQVAFTASSDGRFKTNISEEEVKGLEFIKRLRPVVYNFDTKKFEEFLTKNMPENIRVKRLNRDFTASTKIRHSGFIAQEVEVAAQEIGYNFDGVTKPSNKDDNYSIAYSQFVVPLIKAVQELSTQNDDLKKENVTLHSRLDELDKKITALENLLKQQGGIKEIQSQNEIINSAATLAQNAPNPFNSNTVIRYNIPIKSRSAEVVITNLNGVTLMAIPINTKGVGQIVLTAGTLSSGTYVYSLIIDGKKIESKQMILTK